MKPALGLFLVFLLAACTPTGDTTITGRFGPQIPVSLANLTVIDGRYRVGYTMEIFVSAIGAPLRLTCDVVDVSGRLAAIPGLARTISANRWVRITEKRVVELPDATLGVRCFPETPSDLTVVVRDLQLTAEPVP